MIQCSLKVACTGLPILSAGLQHDTPTVLFFELLFRPSLQLRPNALWARKRLSLGPRRIVEKDGGHRLYFCRHAYFEARGT